jgi:hypothetical protein
VIDAFAFLVHVPLSLVATIGVVSLLVHGGAAAPVAAPAVCDVRRRGGAADRRRRSHWRHRGRLDIRRGLPLPFAIGFAVVARA